MERPALRRHDLTLDLAVGFVWSGPSGRRGGNVLTVSAVADGTCPSEAALLEGWRRYKAQQVSWVPELL